MEGVAKSGTFGAGTTGKTLQEAVFAGLVDPGNLAAVREIVTPTGADLTANGLTNNDVAVFSGPLADYDITPFGAGLKVAHVRGAATDGTDTIYNVEQLRFADQTVSVASILNPTPTAGLSAASLTFAPTTAGAKTASVDIASNAASSVDHVALSGTATTPAVPVAAISPASLGFGNQNTATTSAAQTITVSNTGNANLVVSAVTVTGTNANQFAATPAAGCASIAPAGSCSISVTFAPTTAGAKTASVSITHNAAGSPGSVALTGTGVLSTTASAPASLAMNATRVGASSTKTLTITNTGTAPMTISGVTTTGAAFSANRGTCTAAVAVGKSCKINVTFTPTAIAAFTGSVSIQGNIRNTVTTALSGSGRR
jgi:hypothetical protein